jgi:pimeloyl-ACP methyl ester carboxylesterase
LPTAEALDHHRPLVGIAAYSFSSRTIRIHGHRVTYRMAGDGDPVVLLHGLAGSSTNWRHIMPALAERFTVVAPDLLGFGESAKPRGDYSIGAHAAGVRDLLVALGVESATIVGHSLGGGVAMQLAYLSPGRCQRLVLVSSGGLGREVSPFLRALSLPGSELVLGVALDKRVRRAGEALTGLAGRLGMRWGSVGAEVWRGYGTLTRRSAQQSFVHTVRSVIDPFGQRVSARDRLYLAGAIPTMIVWGDQDRVIPVDHAYAAHRLMPGSRLEILHGVGHLLPVDHADELRNLLVDFIDSTEPASVTEEDFRDAVLARTGAEDPDA